ncbi:MAG TPA: SAM-dependent chlorinase/fluorinase [Candidatus Dormibacteraeota bacterium]|nr:SAM-dependent chlorinase/fluorinase [Candidatus Dormibacteraeota bacterium]
MTAPSITLTTDFGVSDHFVGAMKGVITTIAPEARIHDITHQVSRFDRLGGALTVAQFYRFWPARTIHVVVVDPGVGGARRPLLVSAGSHYFIAPDNGVLSLVFDREEEIHAWHITAEHYFLQPVSRTFHGRDIFAPAAAWLARSSQPESFGPEVGDYERFSLPRPDIAKDRIGGVILRADHFGNLLTNLRPEDAPGLLAGAPFRLSVGSAKITRLVTTFGEGAPDEPCLLVGSSGYFEICVNRSSAAQATAAGSGTPLTIELG